MTVHHKTTRRAGIAALALGAVMAVSGQNADAATVTSSGVVGGCENSVTSGVGVIDVLSGGSWETGFVEADTAGNCDFTLQNPSSSAFAATITVITVDQGSTFVDEAFTPEHGFEDGVGLFSPELSSRDDGLIVGFPEGVGASFPIGFNIARNSAITFDWIWGKPFGFDNGTPRIAFTVDATPVPLPAAGLMLLGGLGGLGGLSALRRRKRAA